MKKARKAISGKGYKNLADLLRIARKAQKCFDANPQQYVAVRSRDILRTTAKRFLPFAFSPSPTQHAFWCREKDLRAYAARGYVRVKHHGRLIRVNELVLTWVPNRMHVARCRAMQEESARRLKKGMKHKWPAGHTSRCTASDWRRRADKQEGRATRT